MGPEWKDEVFVTASEEGTIQLARAFGETLQAPCAVLLQGHLGVGKTTFVRGLVLGLGICDSGVVRSPSFTLINSYAGRLPIYHVDLYRLDTLRDLETIGIEEISEENAIVVVEWSEKLHTVPERGWKIIISDLRGTKRRIEFLRIRPCNAFNAGLQSR